MRPATGSPARTLAGWLRQMRGVLLLLLCAAVPLYGAAGARLSTLGPAHHHRAAPAVDHDHDSPSVAQTWRELVHRGLQALAGQEASQVLDNARARQQQAELQLQRGGKSAHVHAHGLFERHHHLADDPTVVLDDHDGPSLSDAAALGGYVLPMANVVMPRIPMPASANGHWPRAEPPTWRSIGDTRLERPPRR
ncbi:hypothetical protein [Mitsuaria sp. 7]|uniref:hypothetical protein n=1 Tax=Mitsuaria sp. 7 TaxID=1658665 RepID=UPI0007DDB6B4|nr:hypothetical protein [Mitsuaria sp. 7]ANH68479.1 hypothetical protein ABE85_14525 [Mitsuaria sp. 7]